MAALFDLVADCCKSTVRTADTEPCLFGYLGPQERPNVQVRRGGLREELLRAAEAAGSHEDSQRREAIHLQGEELWQEVHNGWKPEEPQAHTHRWGAGDTYM